MNPRTRESLDLLGRKWKVHFVKGRIRGPRGENCDGLTLPDEHKIKVSLNLSRDRQRTKLLHEVLHGIIDVTTGEHRPDEEECVIAFESGLYQVLRVNPWLVEFLLEEDK